MKKIIATLAFSVGLLSTAFAQYDNAKIKIGQKAPEFALTSPEGKPIKLSEVNKGRYVLVDFWASWCGPCRRANPALVAMYKDFTGKKFKGAPNGFTVLSVSLDRDNNAWKQAIQKDGLNWPFHVLDQIQNNAAVAGGAYGVEYIPQAFLIDPKGKIVGKYGAAEAAESDIRKYMQ